MLGVPVHVERTERGEVYHLAAVVHSGGSVPVGRGRGCVDEPGPLLQRPFGEVPGVVVVVLNQIPCVALGSV